MDRAGGNAFIDLQSALAVAKPGDEIRVGQGVYKPAPPGGSREATFALIDGITLQGGYAGTGAANPDHLNPRLYKTILSGDLNGDDRADFTNRSDNSYHVLTVLSPVDRGAALGTTLRGVVIRDGEARTYPSGGDCDWDSPQCRGGGVLLQDGANLVVQQCVIEMNRAHLEGGGMFGPLATLSLRKVTFRQNHLDAYPALARALSVQTLVVAEDCVFSDNRGDWLPNSVIRVGGDVTLDRCVFLDNLSGEGAGVVALDPGSD